MRFLADMMIDARVTEWLRSQGHDVVHLRDQKLHRLPNGEIFEKATEEKRIVLTFDLDFGEIVALSGRQRTSVILFRLHNSRANQVIERLRNLLDELGKKLAESHTVVVVEEARFRVREFPT